MKAFWRFLTTLTLVAGFCALANSSASAQVVSGSGAPGMGSNGASIGKDKTPNDSEVAMELIQPPVAGEEKAFKAFKSFEALPSSDMPKKIQTGESFLQKFPTSTYRSPVYATLAVVYFSTNQTDKAVSAGEKSLELDPKDIRTMGVMCQALARLYNPSQPSADALLAKAEQYGKKAIEVAPTLKKPDTATQQAFDANKNEALAMAHSGLGLVNIRKGKTAEAIQDLDLATKLDHDRDPANLYLLGFANQNAGHFAEAAAAFHRCAAISSNMQDTCKKGEAEAQKRATLQLK